MAEHFGNLVELAALAHEDGDVGNENALDHRLEALACRAASLTTAKSRIFSLTNSLVRHLNLLCT